MWKNFYPDAYFSSTYGIDYEMLWKEGYRGIIFDIDNTLIEHGEPADERCICFFNRLASIGFKTMLLSNNSEPRVRQFHDGVGSPYLFKANKPGRSGYEKAMKEMGTRQINTLFIGDQLFTDIWGAKRCGIPAFLVKPIDKKEEIQIVLKRYLEKIVLAEYRRECKNRDIPFLDGMYWIGEPQK